MLLFEVDCPLGIMNSAKVFSSMTTSGQEEHEDVYIDTI